MSRALYIPLHNGTEQVAVPLDALPDPNEFMQLLRDEKCSIRTWLKCAVSYLKAVVVLIQYYIMALYLNLIYNFKKNYQNCTRNDRQMLRPILSSTYTHMTLERCYTLLINC